MLGGILLALAAAACFEWSYVVQAEQAREVSAEYGLRLSLITRLVRNWRWAGGTALTGVGGLLQVWALTKAPLTVVQPTLAVGLLALPVLAYKRLGEHLRPRDGVGIAAIVGGVSLFAMFGPTHVGRSPAGVELGIVLAALVALLLAPFVLRGRRMPPQLSVAGAAAGDAAAALCLKLAADQLHADTVGVALVWGAAGAACGVFALTAEMSALQRLRATQTAPIVVAAQVLVPVTVGLAFLGETWGHTPGGGVLLTAAVALVVTGGAILAGSHSVEQVVGVAPEDHLGGGGQARE
ncbi:MAG: hypothetical protein QOG68_914 [Solirubrobacteraceae bacterium]|nr:hypothetical protein [Solirubrobacteraceae bacterium]